ncbi:hypothetical protein R1flu_028940 [Riccia fluitans]|uniref:Uncharacterized protein n=1 Tax=Riccia fluitans TaxID=41844 RepID=A0ABD1XN47_9MARC
MILSARFDAAKAALSLEDGDTSFQEIAMTGKGKALYCQEREPYVGGLIRFYVSTSVIQQEKLHKRPLNPSFRLTSPRIVMEASNYEESTYCDLIRESVWHQRESHLPSRGNLVYRDSPHGLYEFIPVPIDGQDNSSDDESWISPPSKTARSLCRYRVGDILRCWDATMQQPSSSLYHAKVLVDHSELRLQEYTSTVDFSTSLCDPHRVRAALAFQMSMPKLTTGDNVCL